MTCLRCPRAAQTRGLCGRCYQYFRRWHRLERVALPPTPRQVRRNAKKDDTR